MVNLLLLNFLAVTGAQALWLATQNMDYSTNTGEGGVFNSPYCQVGKGDTEADAFSQASSTTNGIAIIAGGHCDQLPYQHTNQLGGFWDDHGTINYEDDTTHWFCSTGSESRGSCDAGAGVPKKK
ncbi:hypothetical protein FALBO_3612 [Fusarium albosuccineum]|uniref:Uncharacterized protein n=1 Tax=Fusarium albosuccineum TaxID=1237068 RepID=A0A8H4LKE3_9HYPO|nr:hypothetical protein FALBO_3612 [Fusarium albosuccineum]